jgi:hypothetical protein
LSLFNKIDLNCYVCLPPSNDKLLLITFCAFFPSFISNTSIVSINFRANLDARNVGKAFPGFKFQKISGGVCPQIPLFMRSMSAIHVAFSHCYPPLIYYLTERPFFKKCPLPPHGKILKKGPGRHIVNHAR